MTLLLVFNELDMSWLPLFWLDISRIVFGYQGGADSLLALKDSFQIKNLYLVLLSRIKNDLPGFCIIFKRFLYELC